MTSPSSRNDALRSLKPIWTCAPIAAVAIAGSIGCQSPEPERGAQRTVTVYVSTDRVFSEPVLRQYEERTGVREGLMRGHWPLVVALALVSWTTSEKEFPSASSGWLQRGPRGGTAGAGTIAGVVRLNTPEAPGPTRVENTTDPAVCGRSHTLEDLMVSAKTRGIAHAIVALEDVAPDNTPQASPRRLVLDNRDCRFVPHAAALTLGSVVEMLNSDPVLHTVHLYGPSDLNIALPLQGMKIPRTLDRPGMVVVKCDVHGWMQAFIRVDRHPFHAVTDAAGEFHINGIPPGDYTLSIWHERLGEQRRGVRIREAQVTRADFEYSPNTR